MPSSATPDLIRRKIDATRRVLGFVLSGAAVFGVAWGAATALLSSVPAGPAKRMPPVDRASLTIIGVVQLAAGIVFAYAARRPFERLRLVTQVAKAAREIASLRPTARGRLSTRGEIGR